MNEILFYLALKNENDKFKQQHGFAETMPQLLWTIYKPCCESFLLELLYAKEIALIVMVEGSGYLKTSALYEITSLVC